MKRDIDMIITKNKFIFTDVSKALEQYSLYRNYTDDGE